jgi:hypothetical protein
MHIDATGRRSEPGLWELDAHEDVLGHGSARVGWSAPPYAGRTSWSCMHHVEKIEQIS